AARATGVDIDPMSLEAARYNSGRNAVALDVLDAREALPAAFDITVANILANPLRMLAPLLCSHTRPGGRMALAGVLSEQAAAAAPAVDAIETLEEIGEPEPVALAGEASLPQPEALSPPVAPVHRSRPDLTLPPPPRPDPPARAWWFACVLFAMLLGAQAAY